MGGNAGTCWRRQGTANARGELKSSSFHLQRQAYHKGKLLPERKQQLESIGFVWSVRKTYRHDDSINYDSKEGAEDGDTTKESSVDGTAPPLNKKLKTDSEEGVKVDEDKVDEKLTKKEVVEVEEVIKAEEV